MKDFELGKRIAWLRTDRGIEQREAAADIGIKYHTYQPYEYGRTPSRKNLDKLINFYGCSKSWLLTGEGIPFPDRPADKPDPPSPFKNIVYINPAVRILNDAIGDAGVNLNDAQKAALLKIIQEEIDNAAIKAGNKAKEIINVFKKEV